MGWCVCGPQSEHDVPSFLFKRSEVHKRSCIVFKYDLRSKGRLRLLNYLDPVLGLNQLKVIVVDLIVLLVTILIVLVFVMMFFATLLSSQVNQWGLVSIMY